MGSRIVIRKSKPSSKGGAVASVTPVTAAGTSTGVSSSGNQIPAVTTAQTDKGISVKVDSNDEQIRELALQRVQREEELKQTTALMESRRESATKSADLQRQALALQIEQRGVNIGREMARLNREARISQAEVLSGAASSGATNTSARRGAQIALRSGLARETGNIEADEARNLRADEIRRQEIEANYQSALASAQAPVNIFLDQNAGSTGTTGAGNIVPGANTSGTTKTKTSIVSYSRTRKEPSINNLFG